MKVNIYWGFSCKHLILTQNPNSDTDLWLVYQTSSGSIMRSHGWTGEFGIFVTIGPYNTIKVGDDY